MIEQAALIHRIDAHPEPVFDPWAIANLVPLAGQVGHLLDDEQRRLVDGAIAELADVGWDALPHALIHADLTSGNVLLSPDGEVTILDFALANRWPRLQDLAVIAASLMHGSPGTLPERMRHVARMYSAVAAVPLSAREEEALDAFGRGRGRHGAARRAEHVDAGRPRPGDRPAPRPRDRWPARLRLGVRGRQAVPRRLRAASVRPRSAAPPAGSTAPRRRGSGRRRPLAALPAPPAAQQAGQRPRQLAPGGVGGKLLGPGDGTFGLVDHVRDGHATTLRSDCSRAVPARRGEKPLPPGATIRAVVMAETAHQTAPRHPGRRGSSSGCWGRSPSPSAGGKPGHGSGRPPGGCASSCW